MKTNITSLLIVFILLTSCGTNGKKATEEKSKQLIMGSIHRTITNDLNELFSGYILTSNKRLKEGNLEFMQSVIRLPETFKVDDIIVYTNTYFRLQSDIGLSIFRSWTKSNETSYPCYTMIVLLNESIKDGFHIFYVENNGNKELMISYAVK